jgi:P27 family predicted phage terminase small subunit
MPGPLPKHSDRRQRRNRRDLVVVASDPPATPPPPAGLLTASTRAWGTLWASPLAATFQPSDLPALRRLFELRDERVRAFRVARKDRIVPGSKGQPVLSPMIGYVASLDAEIRNLEDRFGLTPRARLQLGVTFGEAHRSLADVNASFLEDDRHDDDREDPRLD